MAHEQANQKKVVEEWNFRQNPHDGRRATLTKIAKFILVATVKFTTEIIENYILHLNMFKAS